MNGEPERGLSDSVAAVPAWLVSILLIAVAGVMLQNAGYLPGMGGRAVKDHGRSLRAATCHPTNNPPSRFFVKPRPASCISRR